MAADIIPLAARHLRSMGKQKRIDLFLYTLGGDIMTAFRLVALIREYCEDFHVLVPFRCQSAGTLAALGANGIVMLPESQLSPVDPTVTGPYNPPIPGVKPKDGAPTPVLPVSVEEVVAYINLAREVAKIESDAGREAVFDRLATDVRPLALGQVYRARTQIRMLSRKLLEIHMKDEDADIDKIIETLTEKLYSHDYLITRKEAEEIGLKVEAPEPKLETGMVRLYDQYETDFQLRVAFNPIPGLKKNQKTTFVEERACLESVDRLDVYETQREYFLNSQNQAKETHIRESWVQKR